jgi:hypothetical protein
LSDNAVRELESDLCLSLDVDDIMRDLLNQLETRVVDQFFGSNVRSILKKLPEVEREKIIFEANFFLTRRTAYSKDNYDYSAPVPELSPK